MHEECLANSLEKLVVAERLLKSFVNVGFPDLRLNTLGLAAELTPPTAADPALHLPLTSQS